MKYKLIKLLALTSLIFTGCKNKENNSQNEPQEEEPQTEVVEDLTPDFEIDVTLCDTSDMITDKSVYDVKLNYTDKYFKYTASTFKKDLMLLSFGAANSMTEKETGQKFFSDIGFTNLYASPEYDTGGTETSAQYIIAKKQIDDFTVFAVSFKSHLYGDEWANNLTLGESGNHAGFMATGTKVYNNLLNYISGHNNFKLWISGYSRGGGLSNVLSHIVMSNPSLGINETNLYTYTFAGTRCLTKENAKPYKNIFNLYNSADILANFAPEGYGMYRCGTDIDIFDEHVDEYLPSFSPEFNLGEFKPSKGSYKNDKEFTKYFLNELLSESSSYDKEKYPYDLCSREHYYEVQTPVTYLLTHFLSMADYLTVFTEEFKDITSSEVISYLSDDGTKLTEKVKELFDKYDVIYEDDALAESCRVAALLAKRYLSVILECVSNSNAARMIGMHYAETNYILIQRVSL